MKSTKLQGPSTREVPSTKLGPILFRGPMVRAILEGRKTQTRRVVKPQPKLLRELVRGPRAIEYGKEVGAEYRESLVWRGHHTSPEACRRLMERGGPFLAGDALWVRETWLEDVPGDVEHVYYRADGECCEQIPECQCGSIGGTKWKPSIFMPRWASRLTLEVTRVDVERVQSISEEDAMAEGVEWEENAGLASKTARKLFACLWDSLNAKRGYGWETNPWVWVVEFKRKEPSK